MSFLDKFGSKIGLDNTKDNTGKQDNDEYADEINEDDEQNNVVDFQSVAANSYAGSGKQMKVIIIEPKNFADAQQIADHIKSRKPVVLNFENTDGATAKRIIDFISGATYALSGDIKKVGQHIFVCAPHNINVTFSDDLQPKSPTHNDKLPWE